MANFGELVLVIGDLHMPQRAADIPAKVRGRCAADWPSKILAAKEPLRDANPLETLTRQDRYY